MKIPRVFIYLNSKKKYLFSRTIFAKLFFIYFINAFPEPKYLESSFEEC